MLTISQFDKKAGLKQVPACVVVPKGALGQISGFFSGSAHRVMCICPNGADF